MTKAAPGAVVAATVTFFDVVADWPRSSVTVRLTRKTPAALNSCFTMTPSSFDPSPKLQA